jgi:hypothetical protein
MNKILNANRDLIGNGSEFHKEERGYPFSWRLILGSCGVAINFPDHVFTAPAVKI